MPAGSVIEVPTVHVPSLNVPRSQVETDGDATYEHDTNREPGFDAVIVTNVPFAATPPDNVGVLSEVALSVDDEPESLASTKSGAAGAAGAAVSIVNASEFVRPALPAESTIEPEIVQSPSTRLPRSHDVAAPTV